MFHKQDLVTFFFFFKVEYKGTIFLVGNIELNHKEKKNHQTLVAVDGNR